MIHFVDIRGKNKNTAHVKAPADMCYIMQKRGYHAIPFEQTKGANRSISNIFVHTKNWLKTSVSVKNGDTLIYQYPNGLSLYGTFLMNIFARLKKCRIVFLIHDIDSIRGYNEKHSKRREALLKKADYLICHNEKMKQWIIDHGVSQNRVVSMGIFDYITDSTHSGRCLDRAVIIAGNLTPRKSSYIYKYLAMEKGYTINLFGPNFEAHEQYSNYRYFGSFEPEELTEKLEGSYGLVWDGESVDECSGMTGEYLRFNNPHKASLYIAAGIPVIIWKKAALAGYVEEHGIGYTINNLSEIDQIISNTDQQSYNMTCSRVEKEGEKLRSGFYLNKALDSIEKNL